MVSRCVRLRPYRLSYSAYLIQFIFLQPTYDAYFTVNPTDSRALCFSKLSGESNQLARTPRRAGSAHLMLVTPHTSHPTLSLRSCTAPGHRRLVWAQLVGDQCGVDAPPCPGRGPRQQSSQSRGASFLARCGAHISGRATPTAAGGGAGGVAWNAATASALASCHGCIVCFYSHY